MTDENTGRVCVLFRQTSATLQRTKCQLRLRRSGMPSRLSLSRHWISLPLRAHFNCLPEEYTPPPVIFCLSLAEYGWPGKVVVAACCCTTPSYCSRQMSRGPGGSLSLQKPFQRTVLGKRKSTAYADLCAKAFLSALVEVRG